MQLLAYKKAYNSRRTAAGLLIEILHTSIYKVALPPFRLCNVGQIKAQTQTISLEINKYWYVVNKLTLAPRALHKETKPGPVCSNSMGLQDL